MVSENTVAASSTSISISKVPSAHLIVFHFKHSIFITRVIPMHIPVLLAQPMKYHVYKDLLSINKRRDMVPI